MTTTQKSGEYTIRRMQRAELDFAVELAAQEGWNPGLHDANCFYAVDPNGFLIGFLDNEPISCISVVKYPDNYSFLGFYIVKDGYRGQGYGYKIWQAGMDYLDGYTVGLDGVVAQIDNYQKSGFNLAYYNARYQGLALGGGPSGLENIVDLNTIAFEELAKYDQRVFSSPRPAFLKQWISQPETIALGTQINDQLAAYGVARKCREGYKIAPLFADNTNLAHQLFAELSRRLPTAAPIFLDIPPAEINAGPSQIVDEHNMTEVFTTARMYRPNAPDTKIDFPLHKWFGVTSFELG